MTWRDATGAGFGALRIEPADAGPREAALREAHEEIGLEPTVDDYSLKLGSMRPEFDVSLAFNPESVILGVARLGGITFAMVSPSAEAGGKGAPGGTLIAGQGAVAQLDGAIDPGTHALFVDFGGDASALSGGSRAAQFMLLEQAIGEVRSPKALLPNDQRLLTPAGRQTLLGYLSRGSAAPRQAEQRPQRAGADLGNRGGSPDTEGTSPEAPA